ncbi:MAG: HAD-IIB family hydrolase [Clostridia bacterium]|nr:HAD-IIB family hydrolase [Clostridia bacterium]
MSIKLVASDLDGTIISENNFINQSNFEAIDMMNSHNIDFAICTGKSYSVSKSLCDKCKATYGIFSNGSQIYNLKTGTPIYKNVIDLDALINCFNIAKKHGLHVHAYSDNLLVTERLQFLDLRNFKLQKLPGFEFIVVSDVLEYIQKNNLPIYQFVISSNSRLETVRNEILNLVNVSVLKISKFGEYKDRVLNKEYEYLSIMPFNTSKSSALDILGKYLSVNQDEIMAIGDNLNDLDMVKNSGIGVAVANAYSELKDVAKYTTKNNVAEGGFAEAVYKFIEL